MKKPVPDHLLPLSLKLTLMMGVMEKMTLMWTVMWMMMEDELVRRRMRLFGIHQVPWRSPVLSPLLLPFHHTPPLPIPLLPALPRTDMHLIDLTPMTLVPMGDVRRLS